MLWAVFLVSMHTHTMALPALSTRYASEAQCNAAVYTLVTPGYTYGYCKPIDSNIVQVHMAKDTLGW